MTCHPTDTVFATVN